MIGDDVAVVWDQGGDDCARVSMSCERVTVVLDHGGERRDRVEEARDRVETGREHVARVLDRAGDDRDRARIVRARHVRCIHAVLAPGAGCSRRMWHGRLPRDVGRADGERGATGCRPCISTHAIGSGSLPAQEEEADGRSWVAPLGVATPKSPASAFVDFSAPRPVPRCRGASRAGATMPLPLGATALALVLPIACGSAEAPPGVKSPDLASAPAPTTSEDTIAAAEAAPILDAGAHIATREAGAADEPDADVRHRALGRSPSAVLPPEVIRHTVRQGFGRHRLCYEKGLHKDPKLAGKVVVRFVIGKDGSVTSAVDAGSTLPDPAVVACVVRDFRSLTFPPPRGGSGILTVIYPIELDPRSLQPGL
ncbi:Hypothetical protein A7982_01095 [Minicystis rosea]|nr:Hypothetical protein A7982_01095 [Minicystis rosea]